MDVAKQPTDERLLTTANLASREDLTLGGVIVSPSTRTLRGPTGAEVVEPRVMQVLVVLAEAAGQVVTRETLFNRCWGGVYVGDDSLNRAIAALRRTMEAVGGRFEVETIPRTGYRLVVPKGDTVEDPVESHRLSMGLSRRGAVIAGGAVLTAGATGLLVLSNSRVSQQRFDDLMTRATQAVRKEAFDAKTANLVEEALRIRPQSAAGWGLLAYIRSMLVPGAEPKDVPRAVAAAEEAARKALTIDPKEPNARLAMFELEGSTLDWATRDQRLRQIIAVDSTNIGAIGELVLMLQATGLNRESWNWNERALALDPLAMGNLGRRALKLWIAGHVSQADKVIDQVRGLWPSDPWPWWARFLIFALTGRARAAQAMLESNPQMLGPPQEIQLWQTSLAALMEPSPENLRRARDACFNGARMAGQLAGQGVMILSALGDVDAAFDIANGFLLSRGSIVRGGKTTFKPDLNDAGWRINTQWLFTPPAAVMRADARFLPLCDGVGLVDYWRSRGVRPDYQLTER